MRYSASNVVRAAILALCVAVVPSAPLSAQFAGGVAKVAGGPPAKPVPAKPVVDPKPMQIRAVLEPGLAELTPATPAPPPPLTKAEVIKQLGDLGLEVTSLEGGAQTRLTVNSRKSAVANLTLFKPMMSATPGSDGFAVYLGGLGGHAVIRLNAVPGNRYLFDIAVGDNTPAAGTRKYQLIIRAENDKKAINGLEMTLGKNGQHLLAVVDAHSDLVIVTIKAVKPDTGKPDDFVFHSAEITNLK